MQTPLSILLKDKGYHVHSIAPGATGYECAEKLNEFGVGALLVIEKEKLLGIVSERDFIRKLLARHQDPTTILVRDFMTKDVVTVLPTTTVQEAIRLVTDRRLRHLPVIENGKLIGIISIGDLTRWVMLAQEQEIEALTGYIHGQAKN